MGKALVVNDGLSCCEELRCFLKARGYDVVEAKQGWETLRAYGLSRPDLVLMDVREPSDGILETLRDLKAFDPVVGVIVVSASCEEEAARRILAEGAWEYIARPVDFDYLELALITRLCYQS